MDIDRTGGVCDLPGVSCESAQKAGCFDCLSPATSPDAQRRRAFSTVLNAWLILVDHQGLIDGWRVLDFLSPTLCSCGILWTRRGVRDIPLIIWLIHRRKRIRRVARVRTCRGERFFKLRPTRLRRSLPAQRNAP